MRGDESLRPHQGYKHMSAYITNKYIYVVLTRFILSKYIHIFVPLQNWTRGTSHTIVDMYVLYNKRLRMGTRGELIFDIQHFKFMHIIWKIVWGS